MYDSYIDNFFYYPNIKNQNQLSPILPKKPPKPSWPQAKLKGTKIPGSRKTISRELALYKNTLKLLICSPPLTMSQINHDYEY